MNSGTNAVVDKLTTFESTFRNFYAPLCNFANKYLNDWDASEDAVQSSFLKIWNNWDTYINSSSQKSYIFRTTKNTVLDYLKKEDRKNKREKVYQELNDSKEDILNEFVIKSEIMKSLDKLKPKVRKIFLLNKIEGLTYPEIAQYLQISERTVEDNMARAFKALREDLKNNEHLLR